MRPRDGSALPETSSQELPRGHNKIPNFNKNSKLNIDHVLSTCRLITINKNDYDALYPDLLSKHISSTTKNTDSKQEQPLLLNIPKQSDESEFFALSCLERLTWKALSYYPSDVVKDMDFLKSQLTNAAFYKSKTYNAIHVRLGEMQTLEVMRNVAISGMRQMLTRIQSRIAEEKNSGNEGKTDLSHFKVRKNACPYEWSKQILVDIATES